METRPTRRGHDHVQGRPLVGRPDGKPELVVSISGRQVHLTDEHVDTLFGRGRKLTPELVEVHGGQGRIVLAKDAVRGRYLADGMKTAGEVIRGTSDRSRTVAMALAAESRRHPRLEHADRLLAAELARMPTS